ncbi:MAG: class I SAM-dependent methyltransferase [Candidatus Methanofastidiosum sp.]|nr:class I SAM-dependent methyltransferase [Methanofastidiosum sp.]
MEANKKTTKDYWEDVWGNENKYNRLDIKSSNFKTCIKNYHYRKVFRKINPVLSKLPKGAKILELGCANSPWLPFLAKEYGFQVEGIDYSKKGCKLCEKILQEENIKNFNIACSDFFDIPKEMENRYDMAFSFGVVEHFKNPDEIINIFSSVLKEDGILITGIPNMGSFYGKLQKYFNEEIYKLHNPLNLDDLSKSYSECGLKILDMYYLYNFNLNNINPGDTQRKKIYKILNNKISKIFCIFLDSILSIIGINNKYISSYMIIMGKK